MGQGGLVPEPLYPLAASQGALKAGTPLRSPFEEKQWGGYWSRVMVFVHPDEARALPA